jgi:Tol biopolymer transport system component
MAVSLHPVVVTTFEHRGTLAQVPAAGGAPREILKDVESADWSPDGKSLAVVRAGATGARLEYPVGKVLYETHGWIAQVRVSPDGERVAFIDHPTPADDGGTVAQVDRAGKKTTLSKPFASLYGLAWSPDGGEVWFTAAEAGVNRALYSARAGRQRLRVRIPGNLVLHDISRDGRLLVARDSLRNEIIALAPGESKERDLTWFDWSVPSVISRDGRTVLFVEAGEGGGAGYSVYLRKTDGSPAVRLGEGNAQDISPDGQWVLALQNPAAPRLVAYPTGAGDPKPFAMDRAVVLSASFLPDGKRIFFTAIEEGHGPRVYLRDFDGGAPRALTPEGYTSSALVTPDGTRIAVRGPDRKRYLYPVAGGEPTQIPGTEAGEIPMQFDADGRHLFTQPSNEVPATVSRVDLATGKKEPWRTIVPGDPAGVSSLFVIPVPDGSGYVYGYARSLSELFLLRNVP